MRITIENMQAPLPMQKEIDGLIQKAVKLCVDIESFEPDFEVGIFLVNNDEIRDINREHRQIDKPTDVLSFPLVDMQNGNIISSIGDYNIEEKLLMLGDIVISLEMARKQCEEYGHSFERELIFLVTHGMFHLLGYDHQNEEDESVMMDKQEIVLTLLGLKRNAGE